MKYFWLFGSVLFVGISIYCAATNNPEDAWFLACGAFWYAFYVQVLFYENKKNRKEN